MINVAIGYRAVLCISVWVLNAEFMPVVVSGDCSSCTSLVIIFIYMQNVFDQDINQLCGKYVSLWCKNASQFFCSYCIKLEKLWKIFMVS